MAFARNPDENVLSQAVNVDLCMTTIEKMLQILNDTDCNCRELIVILGNMMASIGYEYEKAEGYELSMPLEHKQVFEHYKSRNSVGAALMLLGTDLWLYWAKI